MQIQRLPFVKMEGAGNDYVFVDGINPALAILDLPAQEAAEFARRISDRNFGVGGDGLILLAPSSKADLRMVMWNADGSRGPMCGNGIRCLAKLAYDLGVVHKTEMLIETDSGIRKVALVIDDGGLVTGARVDMGKVELRGHAEPVTIDGREWLPHVVDAGSRHAVIFVDDDPEQYPVGRVGAAIQALPRFEGGVNVEFVQALADGSLRQRTFERGSGETLACGSGATAAAGAAMALGLVPGPEVPVVLRGGTLKVSKSGSSLVMEGPARTVFSGEFGLSI